MLERRVLRQSLPLRLQQRQRAMLMTHHVRLITTSALIAVALWAIVLLRMLAAPATKMTINALPTIRCRSVQMTPARARTRSVLRETTKAVPAVQLAQTALTLSTLRIAIIVATRATMENAKFLATIKICGRDATVGMNLQMRTMIRTGH